MCEVQPTHIVGLPALPEVHYSHYFLFLFLVFILTTILIICKFITP